MNDPFITWKLLGVAEAARKSLNKMLLMVTKLLDRARGSLLAQAKVVKNNRIWRNRTEREVGEHSWNWCMVVSTYWW